MIYSSPRRRADWLRRSWRIRSTNFNISKMIKRRTLGNLQWNLTCFHHQNYHHYQYQHQHHHHHNQTANHQTLQWDSIHHHLIQTHQLNQIEESRTKRKSLEERNGRQRRTEGPPINTNILQLQGGKGSINTSHAYWDTPSGNGKNIIIFLYKPRNQGTGNIISNCKEDITHRGILWEEFEESATKDPKKTLEAHTRAHMRSYLQNYFKCESLSCSTGDVIS